MRFFIFISTQPTLFPTLNPHRFHSYWLFFFFSLPLPYSILAEKPPLYTTGTPFDDVFYDDNVVFKLLKNCIFSTLFTMLSVFFLLFSFFFHLYTVCILTYIFCLRNLNELVIVFFRRIYLRFFFLFLFTYRYSSRTLLAR